MDINTLNLTTQTKESQASISPEHAVSMLKEGNKRFLETGGSSRDYFEQIKMTAQSQHPFAAILTCMDSRVPVEKVFDQGIGDVFTLRIAGNYVEPGILGSLEFACKVAGAKAILVLGHTKCGAIKGACTDVKLGNLTKTLEFIKPAVNKTKAAHPELHHEGDDFAHKVTVNNVVLNVEAIREQSEVLRELHDEKAIEIIGGVYDVATGKVDFI